MAAVTIAKDPEDYGFENVAYHRPLEYDEVTIDSPMDIDVIARCAETTIDEIKELNPELKRWGTPPNVLHYTIRIPPGTKDIFVENLSKLPDNELFTVTRYEVKRGDTLKKIANRFRIPPSVILAANSFDKHYRPHAGDYLLIPPKDKGPLSVDNETNTKRHKVKNLKKRLHVKHIRAVKTHLKRKVAKKRYIVTSAVKKDKAS